MRDIYGIGDFLFNVWLLIKEIINLIFCIFFTFATLCVVFLIQFACLIYVLETGEIVLSEPYSSIVLYTMIGFAIGCAVIVAVNYDKLFGLKNNKNE
jgi:hypothetical protein